MGAPNIIAALGSAAAEELVKEVIRSEIRRGELSWWLITFRNRETQVAAIAVRAFGKIDAIREAGWRGCDKQLDPRRMSGVSFDRMREDFPRDLIGRLLTSDLERQRAEEFRA